MITKEWRPLSTNLPHPPQPMSEMVDEDDGPRCERRVCFGQYALYVYSASEKQNSDVDQKHLTSVSIDVQFFAMSNNCNSPHCGIHPQVRCVT